MPDDLDDARALLPGVALEPVATLGGSDRSAVRRVAAGDSTLIVKEFLGAGEGWVRESAALSVMPAGAPTPRLIAAGGEPPIVIMSDLGTGGSVADALLGPDPTAAETAVLAWATTIATLHHATSGSRDAFRSALAARAGDFPVAESVLATDLAEAADVVTRYCAELGVEVPAGVRDEIRGIGERLGGDGPAAMTPADACPDNNVMVDGRLMLIDFEGAQWRHIAWDLAYLAVPWPTCWCSWRMPAELTGRAIEAYRAVNPVPYVDTPQFRRDVTAAAVGWSWISASWFLTRALADDPPLTTVDKPTPTRRAMILHRLGGTRDQVVSPLSAELAGRLHEALRQRWGSVPLAYAPAFGG